jgi:phage-related protein
MYKTTGGRSLVSEFLAGLPKADFAQVYAAMSAVAVEGLGEARHLRGDIYEVRATGGGRCFRVLFALEGGKGQILLGLEGFTKKTQRTPAKSIDLAESRLADWRGRAKPRSLS